MKKPPQMIDILQNTSKSALVYAIEANLVEWSQLYRRCPQLQAEVYGEPNLTGLIANIPIAILNSIFSAQLTPDNIDATIEAVIARGKSRNVPLLWWIGPATKPNNLERYLESYGFVHELDVPGMALDLLALHENLQLPSGLTIEQVQDLDTLKVWCHIASICFEWPDFAESAFLTLISESLDTQMPFYHYIGYLNGEPVATSSLLLGAGVAGLYNVATLPDARRQGIGTAITLAALRDARATGYRISILHAYEMGFNIYHRLGFQEYCKINHYVWANEHKD